MKRKQFRGFTAAEVMIAMTIVGIITALTIPTIMANYQNKSMLTTLQKNYVELTDNLLYMGTETYNKSFYKSLLSLQGRSVDATAGKFFDKYYRTATKCGTTAQPCFASTYRAINNAEFKDFKCENGYSVTLNTGTAMCIIPADAPKDATEDTPATTGKPAKVYIDVNGSEKPNIGGRDMFTLYIYDDFSIDDKDITPDVIKNGNAETARETLFNSTCRTSYTGEGCFGKIMNDNWRIEY